MQKYSILIVDDHILFREGLRKICNHWEEFEVVGEAENGITAVALAQSLLPDIVLMDISMPEMNGIEATRRISKTCPSVNVVILTVSEEEKNLLEAVKNGAKGYVLKDTPSRRLHDQLRGVIQGEAPLSGIMAEKILNEFKSPKINLIADEDPMVEPLTEQEQRVLILVSDGLTNAEIGDQLSISENTVKKYLHNILSKLHLNNRVEAAVYAVRKGLTGE